MKHPFQQPPKVQYRLAILELGLAAVILIVNDFEQNNFTFFAVLLLLVGFAHFIRAMDLSDRDKK